MGLSFFGGLVVQTPDEASEASKLDACNSQSSLDSMPIIDVETQFWRESLVLRNTK